MLGFWSLLQTLTTAYGRASGVLSPRYLDLYAVCILVSLVSWPAVFGSLPARRRWVGRFVMALWVVSMLGGLASLRPQLEAQLSEKRQQSEIQLKNTAAFLASGDRQNLLNKPFLALPYPSAEKLETFLRQPSIRSILPAEILPRRPLRRVESAELRQSEPSLSASDGGQVLWAGEAPDRESVLELRFETPTEVNDHVPCLIQGGVRTETQSWGPTTPGWHLAYAPVHPGAFVIAATESAVFSEAAFLGTFDRMVNLWLQRWWLFIGLGLLAWCIAGVLGQFEREPHSPLETPR